MKPKLTLRDLFWLMLVINLSGCSHQHKNVVSTLFADIERATSIELESRQNGVKRNHVLSASERGDLKNWIAHSSLEANPLKWDSAGSLTLTFDDAESQTWLILFISEQEMGLRIDTDTYLRNMSPSGLNKLTIEHKDARITFPALPRKG